MITILHADDHEMVRIGIRAYVNVQPDMQIIAEATNGEEAVTLALAHRPDIIIMDNVMPLLTGPEAATQIINAWPSAKIMMLTSFLDDDKVYPALEAGAVSYILKTSNAKQIVQAIRTTLRGESALEPEVTTKMMTRMRAPVTTSLHEQLTERELEILLLLADGLTNQMIADDLHIAIKTVKTHVSNILSKLDVQDRTQAVVYAFQHRLK